MTFMLRALSLVSAFLMVAFLLMPIMAIKYGASPIRDTLASVFFIILAILAARCTKWFWQKRRFWTEVHALSEVSTFAACVLVILFFNPLEHRTTGMAKDAVHIVAVLVIVAVYLLVKRYARAKITL